MYYTGEEKEGEKEEEEEDNDEDDSNAFKVSWAIIKNTHVTTIRCTLSL